MDYKGNQTYKSIKTFGFDKPNNVVFYELSIGNDGDFANPIPVKRKNPKALMECALCDGIERNILGTAYFSFNVGKDTDIYHQSRH